LESAQRWGAGDGRGAHLGGTRRAGGEGLCRPQKDVLPRECIPTGRTGDGHTGEGLERGKQWGESKVPLMHRKIHGQGEENLGHGEKGIGEKKGKVRSLSGPTPFASKAPPEGGRKQGAQHCRNIKLARNRKKC